jgi:hypothetical protein
MKINFVPSLIALALGALIAYGLYSMSIDKHKLLIGVGSFVFMAISLIMVLGISFDKGGTNANVKSVSMIFFILALTSNITFSFVDFYIPVYIITNGCLLLLLILVSYFIVKAKQ